jgi:hypothetical protein
VQSTAAFLAEIKNGLIFSFEDEAVCISLRGRLNHRPGIISTAAAAKNYSAEANSRNRRWSAG